MAVNDEDIAHALDLFGGLGPLTTRKMMGGLCLYSEGVIFAILNADGSVWLKGAGDFIKTLEAMDCERWTYERANGKITAMPYWALPDSAVDDPSEATDLARQALTFL